MSGNAESLFVHHVHMPENAVIFVGFYSSDGTLLQAHTNPAEKLSCISEDLSYAIAYAWEQGSLSPLCDSYKLIFKE